MCVCPLAVAAPWAPFAFACLVAVLVHVLILQVLSASEEDAGLEAEPGAPGAPGAAGGPGRKPGGRKKAGNMAEFAGGEGMTYIEYGTGGGGRGGGAAAQKPRPSEKAAEMRKKLKL